MENDEEDIYILGDSDIMQHIENIKALERDLVISQVIALVNDTESHNMAEHRFKGRILDKLMEKDL